MTSTPAQVATARAFMENLPLDYVGTGDSSGAEDEYEADVKKLAEALAAQAATTREECARIAENTTAPKPLHLGREARKPPKTPSLARQAIAAAIRAGKG